MTIDNTITPAKLAFTTQDLPFSNTVTADPDNQLSSTQCSAFETVLLESDSVFSPDIPGYSVGLRAHSRP